MTATVESVPTRTVDLLGLELPKLTPQQELALLARLLWREGYDDRVAGHMTYKLDDDTLLVTPWGPTWKRLRGEDILRTDRQGNLLEGKWRVNPAALLHFVAHDERPDAVVTVHTHPQWATVWAVARRIPPIYDQLGAFVEDDLVLYNDLQGGVNVRENALANVRAMDGSRTALLANHGVFVLADSVKRAHLRCVAVEHRCKLAWRAEALGGGHTVPPEIAADFARQISEYGDWPYLFEAMSHEILADDPTFLNT